MSPTNPELNHLLSLMRELQAEIRDSVVEACERAEAERSSALSGIAQDTQGDTIYAIDKISEERLVVFFESRVAPIAPVVLIAEGLHDGKVILPKGTLEADCKWRIIVDPIDGTRGIMYQKRSAWILTGIAPNKGESTNLQDIEAAIQTEIPLIKQHLCDVAWAVRGEGAQAERYNRITKTTAPLALRPSQEPTISHGFASVVRFFPGVREEISAIDEELTLLALGPIQEGKAHCFEDQYACTGGQLYGLMCGQDRFIADLRPLMAPYLTARGLPRALCCHPYDLCTLLIAAEMGVVVNDENGAPVRALLDVEPDVSWCGYANAAIQRQIEAPLHGILKGRGLV